MPKKTLAGTGKPNIRRAIDLLRDADAALEVIRDHFDMEWGDNAHTDLDIALSSVIRDLGDCRNKLDDVLLKFRGRALKPNYPRKRQPKKSITVKDLQKALCC